MGGAIAEGVAPCAVDEDEPTCDALVVPYEVVATLLALLVVVVVVVASVPVLVLNEDDMEEKDTSVVSLVLRPC